MTKTDNAVFKNESNDLQLESSENPEIAKRIRTLVSQQPFGILCTQGDNQPYGSLIAYAFTDDLKHFFFTTPSATRKFKLLIECHHVALLIDNRNQHKDELEQIEAITVTGQAAQIHSDSGDFETGIAMLRKRHAYLSQILGSDETALFRIDVTRYVHVTRFQDVCHWIP